VIFCVVGADGNMGQGENQTREQLFASLRHLVESWCDRRCLRALRAVLRGYPLVSPLTDGWGELLLALQDVRAFTRDELTEDERQSVDDCIRTVERTLRPGRL
jgi:hypothetical protein